MVDTDKTMKDVEQAVRKALSKRFINTEYVVELVREIVVPVFDNQVLEFEEQIEELAKIKGEVQDRKREDERQGIINIFNECYERWCVQHGI